MSVKRAAKFQSPAAESHWHSSHSHPRAAPATSSSSDSRCLAASCASTAEDSINSTPQPIDLSRRSTRHPAAGPLSPWLKPRSRMPRRRSNASRCVDSPQVQPASGSWRGAWTRSSPTRRCGVIRHYTSGRTGRLPDVLRLGAADSLPPEDVVGEGVDLAPGNLLRQQPFDPDTLMICGSRHGTRRRSERGDPADHPGRLRGLELAERGTVSGMVSIDHRSGRGLWCVLASRGEPEPLACAQRPLQGPRRRPRAPTP